MKVEIDNKLKRWYSELKENDNSGIPDNCPFEEFIDWEVRKSLFKIERMLSREGVR